MYARIAREALVIVQVPQSRVFFALTKDFKVYRKAPDSPTQIFHTIPAITPESGACSPKLVVNCSGTALAIYWESICYILWIHPRENRVSSFSLKFSKILQTDFHPLNPLSFLVLTPGTLR